ncbi:MAG: acyl-CoA thioesterase [Desulfobacterales bacterium]|nr:acyl-CoA thioesterase [Desulfobacterales bacterium]
MHQYPYIKESTMKTVSEIKIRGYHIDHFKHVNNARYLEFLEEGRWHYSEKNGLIDAFHKQGISHVTVNININFRRSVLIGQVLRIETGVGGKGRKSFTMAQKILLGGSDALIADAVVTNVLLDMHTGKPLPISAATVGFWPDLANLDPQPESCADAPANCSNKGL